MKRKMLKFAIAALAALALFAWAGTAAVAAEGQVLKLATTTSTNDTGLLDYLQPILLADTGIAVQWVSVGTGAALEHGKNGDVDVVLTHDPEAEKAFVADGWGVEPKRVMYNDFVLLGPAGDPAGVKGKPVSDALGLIAQNSAPFASRADKSGTNMAELRLWRGTGSAVPDKESWYIQTGQGMMATLNVAGERGAYAIADRGTFITYESANKGKPPVIILVEGDETLRNQYSVIPVNPEKHNVNHDLARRYAEWLTSPKVQQDIANYKLEGKQLFFPNAE